MTLQFETNAEALKSTFAAMGGIIEKRNTIPILGSVLVQSGKITGTDLDMEVTANLPGKTRGGACIPWSQANKLLSQIPSDESVTVNNADGFSSFAFNGADYKFPSYPAGDYPEFSGKIDGAETQLGNAGLLAAIKAIRFAISTEETRYYLNGICFSENADGLPVIVATNGHQLAAKPLPFEIEGSKGKILPRKAVDYILSRKADPVSCRFGETACRFDWPGLTFKSKLIDGTYPDWHRVVPTGEFSNSLEVRIADILPPLNRIQSLLKKPFRAVKMSVQKDGGLILSVTTPDIGECHERLEWNAASSEMWPYEFSMNGRYLLNAIEAFKGCETLLIESHGAGDPHVFTSPQSDLKCVIMPMRV